jgi:uncharacterized repeat protein (TIGR03803 family)
VPSFSFPRRKAWTESLIRGFGISDGANPSGRLIFDHHGRLVGTTQKGTVYQLAPPAGGQTVWEEYILYIFPSKRLDGKNPLGGVIEGEGGPLYGITQFGGRYEAGVVFRLTPPGPSRTMWHEKILHNFVRFGRDGFEPRGAFAIESDSNLYGTTPFGGIFPEKEYLNGTIFEVSPPQAGRNIWAKTTILHSFDGNAGDGGLPTPDLLLRNDGKLYGTTTFGGLGMGTVFRLAPPSQPGDPWTETLLHRFPGGLAGKQPLGGLTEQPNGPVFGTTAAGGAFREGTVFMIKP